MPQLLPDDVSTKEVLSWQGLHLFHFADSTCSQKIRIFLSLKGIEWQSHHLNLARKAHQTPFYMGINPRGLVPTLVHDGKVIIESNDILTYLDRTFPQTPLIPEAHAAQIAARLQVEDDLHLPIRAITMRFVFPSFLAKRSEEEIVAYEGLGTGTVRGVADPHKAREVAFWRRMAENGYVPDADIIDAYRRFDAQLEEFDDLLQAQDFLVGDQITVADIAWYIYLRRLGRAGFPLNKYTNVIGWYAKLHAKPGLADQVPSGGPARLITKGLHIVQFLKRSRLRDVVARAA